MWNILYFSFYERILVQNWMEKLQLCEANSLYS